MLRTTWVQAFSLAVISPLVFAGAVSATPEPLHGKSPIPSVQAVVTPVAAVSPNIPDLSDPVVIAVDRDDDGVSRRGRRRVRTTSPEGGECARRIGAFR